jgi:3-dehydroquinate dehydratase-2
VKILVLNGPNLNLLGVREPAIYGKTTLDEINRNLSAEAGRLGVTLEFLQSNHEGELIDALHRARGESDGVILNPGALTHTSLALADAIRSVSLPTVEVHVSNIHAREERRRHSVTAEAALGIVAGFGPAAYVLALRGLVGHLSGST